MTRVQIRLTAVIAALALVASCALLYATPRQAYADTLVSVGKSAVNLDYSKKKSLTASEDGYFNSSVGSKFYKFTTSARNSSYRLSFSNLDQQDFDVFLYDSRGREIDRWSTEDRMRKLYTDLDRSGVYYIEMRRDTNVTARADYTITLKEVITPPAPVTKFRVKSTSKGKVTVSY